MKNGNGILKGNKRVEKRKRKVKMTERVVALIDMDCFYCQVEIRSDPAKLSGIPLAVVQYNQWKGGGIIAVNYEARGFGVKRGMRGDEARQKCPDIKLIPVPEARDKADLTKYREAGMEVIQSLLNFDLNLTVERASVDEAFVDLTKLVEFRIQNTVPNFAQKSRFSGTNESSPIIVIIESIRAY